MHLCFNLFVNGIKNEHVREIMQVERRKFIHFQVSEKLLYVKF